MTHRSNALITTSFVGGFYAVNARATAFNSKGTSLVNNEVTMKPYVRHP